MQPRKKMVDKQMYHYGTAEVTDGGSCVSKNFFPAWPAFA